MLANSPIPEHPLHQASYGSGRACGPKGFDPGTIHRVHLFQMPQLLISLRLAQVTCQFERIQPWHPCIRSLPRKLYGAWAEDRS